MGQLKRWWARRNEGEFEYAAPTTSGTSSQSPILLRGHGTGYCLRHGRHPRPASRTPALLERVS